MTCIVTASVIVIVSVSSASRNEGVSVTVIVSVMGMVTTIGGGGGGGAVLPAPLSAMDCVKLEPAWVLATLLRPALSVNVIVPLGAGPEGATNEIVKLQTPPAGSVVGSDVAPLVQEMGPTVKAELCEIAAEESVSGASPMSDAWIDCVAVCPAATLPKPRLPAE